MNITIVGTGYVGLVTGACFADMGAEVTCIDIDSSKIENLKKNILPIYEPGLDVIVGRNCKRNKLKFSTDLKNSIRECDVIFIAVGTPPDEDGSADLDHVIRVAEEIGKHITGYMVVVTKSTVPVGTAEKVRQAIDSQLKSRKLDIKFDIASNPEFLKEGAAIDDFMKPDRIVIGIESEKGRKIMEKLYKPFTLNGHPIIFMDIASAEMTKYAANAMLATRISFMNEIANLCEILGADINMVRKGIGSDPRIGNQFIYAGIGYGGSCFPKDVRALIKTARQHNYKMRVVQAVEYVNDHQKTVLVDKMKKHFKNNLDRLNVAIWGLAFKPQTDDMREAPSLAIIEKLLKEGCNITAFDPEAMKQAQKITGNKITYAKNKEEAVANADCLLLITEWNVFRIPDFKKMYELMKQPVIFDGRNIYNADELKTIGFLYYCVGKRTQT